MKDNGKRKYVIIKSNKQTVQCLLDTGSDIFNYWRVNMEKNKSTETTEHG